MFIRRVEIPGLMCILIENVIRNNLNSSDVDYSALLIACSIVFSFYAVMLTHYTFNFFKFFKSKDSSVTDADAVPPLPIEYKGIHTNPEVEAFLEQVKSDFEHDRNLGEANGETTSITFKSPYFWPCNYHIKSDEKLMASDVDRAHAKRCQEILPRTEDYLDDACNGREKWSLHRDCLIGDKEAVKEKLKVSGSFNLKDYKLLMSVEGVL